MERDQLDDSSGSDNEQEPLRAADYHIQSISTTYTYKIILVGDSNVGKTSLTWRFCRGQFLDRNAATIGVDFNEKVIEMEKQIIKLQIWDTAGQERFRKSMVQHYYRNVHAVIFCYDITRMASFDALTIWLDEFDRYSSTKNIPRILVGNKCDCKDRKVVSSSLARKFADAHNMPLWETSAKDDREYSNIQAIFLTLAHKLKHQRLLMAPRKELYGIAKPQLETLTEEAHQSPVVSKSCRCWCRRWRSNSP